MLEKEKNVTVKWNNRAVKGNNSKSSGEQTLENDLFWQPAAMHAALLTGTYPTSVIPGSSGTYRRCGSTQVGPYLFTYAFREHRPRWGFCSVSGGSHYVYGVESKTAGVSHNRGKVHTDCLDGMFSSNQRDLPSSVCVCVCVPLWGSVCCCESVHRVYNLSWCLLVLHMVTYFHIDWNKGLNIGQ